MGLALTAGDILRGKYRLEHVLGRGGMGTVYLATHLVIGQRVAIKIVTPSPSEHTYVVARFLREARAAALLESEHVVRILDVDEEVEQRQGGVPAGQGNTPFMVMEYLHGSDLGAILRKSGRLPLPEAVSYVLQACEALAEAHAAGIVHRDLKPSNLFRAETARKEPIIKLLDFGISKLTLPGEDLSLTDTQAVIGSPLFMSPEQLLSSRDVDHRTDIWSLGVTLYQLAAGALPFEASSASALGAQIAARPPRTLSAVLPEVPRDLEAVVMRCLARAPGDRFADIVSLARALGSYATEDAVAAVERAAERGARGRRPSLETEAPAPSVVEASGERWTQSRVGADVGASAAAAEEPSQRDDHETQSREQRIALVDVHPESTPQSPAAVTALAQAYGPRSVTGPTGPTAPELAHAPALPTTTRRSDRRVAAMIVLAFVIAAVVILAVVVIVLKMRDVKSATIAATATATPTSSSPATATTTTTTTTFSSTSTSAVTSAPISSSSPSTVKSPMRPGARTAKPGTTWSKDPSELELK